MISAENGLAIDNHPLSDALPSDQIGFKAFIIIPLPSELDFRKAGFEICVFKYNQRRIITQLRGELETQIKAYPDSRTGRWESRRVLILRIQRIVDRTPERATCRGLVPHRRCDEGVT